MAIEKLFQDNFEFFTLETNPSRTFSSSSSGLTGTVRLFPRASSIEKEAQPLSVFSSSFYQDENLENLRNAIVGLTGSDISGQIEGYMRAVTEQQESVRKQQTLEIIRFTPSFRFSSNTLRKNVVKDILMPYYRTVFPRAHYNYTNYHCLNFFTGSVLPEDAVLLYPNSTGSVVGNTTGSLYQISGAFTFDFWIKPTYTTDAAGLEYKPGTIMHLTGAYALSLHSGSSVDLRGRPDYFRVALALSDSANIPPSDLLLTGSSPFFQSHIIYSSDNSLPVNKWSHVTIRWGGERYNFGSGSIVINNNVDTNFVLTSSLVVGVQDSGPSQPTVLCVGNYYEGGNSGTSAVERFFAADPAKREGLTELVSTTGINNPVSYSFTHPLNSEIHEIKLYNRYLTIPEIEQIGTQGPSGSALEGLQFYLPPFFTEVSPYRQSVGTFGGVLVTPFFEEDGTTNDPFAAKMAFGAGGHYINLENYVRDFATGNYPRLWSLSGSTLASTTDELSANGFLYSTGSVQKRLYLLLPCDNGEFLPNFDLLNQFTGSAKLIDDLGNKEPGVISLREIVDANDFASKAIQTSGSILDDILGARPEDVSALPGNSLAILHRTRDGSSNQVVFFDISNMFYGKRIHPGTLVIRDTSLSASAGKVSITIKDDGKGNLYRANSDNLHPTWASVGNVFYDEGIVVIKHPQLFFFGEEQFEISFRGEQNIHVLTINAFAKALTQTSSSSPAYVNITPADLGDDLANNNDDKIVFITGINIHDENLNVIARTNLAQPLMKRSGDKFLFKIKLDF